MSDVRPSSFVTTNYHTGNVGYFIVVGDKEQSVYSEDKIYPGETIELRILDVKLLYKVNKQEGCRLYCTPISRFTEF